MSKLFIQDFKRRILKKQVRIAVVGLGYVGLPLAMEFIRKGFVVIGIDVDKERIERIKKGVSYITDVPTDKLRKAVAGGRFKPTQEFSYLKDADVIIVCVPTPLKRKTHPDISFIIGAVRQIKKYLRLGHLVVLESTTYPGTTEEVILPLLESSGLKCGRDFYLAFSPERIDPGNAKFPVNKIPKVIGGITKEATVLTQLVYGNIVKRTVPVSSSRVAETVKLLENTFRIVNIGLIDEIAMMAHKMNIDIWEIIEAARTKPFGFMPFYPGPGVGGHCLDKSESIYVKDKNSLKIMQMDDFIKYMQANVDTNVEVLSFDPIKKTSVFKKVIAASARPYSGNMVNILTEDGRSLKATDLHPIFVYNGNRWGLKYAKDLRKGDNLAICLNLPYPDKQNNPEARIDLIEEILKKGQYLIDKIRLKPTGFAWKDYAAQIKHILRHYNSDRLPDICWDYLSDNYLPLKYFYDLEKLTSIDRSRLRLVSGRGPGYSEIPAVVNLNYDFCRLIGYYLSEGCYTKDKSARIRFSFNRSEKEYIQDVLDILHSLGIRASIYESKKWHTSCIKVSSNLFGFLIYEVLGCGRNCYEMNIPELIFSLGKEEKKAILSGILRGDASVGYFFGKWHYRRNGKEYLHNVNTANITFFTSSKRLFQQLIILLHDLNIIPAFGKRKYTLSIFGYNQLAFLKDLFAGRKKEIIERYLKLNKNRQRNKTFRKFSKFAVVKIKSVSLTKGDWVYSLETVKPHSFVTSYGIIVHNCIPKDPLYLYWKAKKFGFKSRFIKLASDIVTYMPDYIVGRVDEILKKKGIALKKSRILVAGVTYKKDIKDLRKSPALDIIEILQKKNADVSYYDPLIPYLKLNNINLKSVKLSAFGLSRFDCVIIATDHSNVDYNFILKHSRLIFDTRNVYKGVEDRKLFRL